MESVEVAKVSLHRCLLPVREPELADHVLRGPVVGVDDPKDFPCVIIAGHLEESEARLRGVAPTASRGNESVAPLQPAAAVELDPVDARLADDDPGASLDDRLLREGELYAPGEHAVEARMRLVGRFGGWTWRYDLTPAGPSETKVTPTYDWSAVPGSRREHIGIPPFPPDHLGNSPAHLADLATSRQDRRPANRTARSCSDIGYPRRRQ
jgi:hypothetical protein